MSQIPAKESVAVSTAFPASSRDDREEAPVAVARDRLPGDVGENLHRGAAHVVHAGALGPGVVAPRPPSTISKT
nr:hypothetical protein [Methylobacterium oxalidis]